MTCAPVLAAIAALATFAAPALAQQQIDIEALKAQLKGMPGGEEAIRKLEANRGQIESANKKMAAQRAASGAGAGPGAAAGFDKPALAVLALVPTPPRSTDEAKSRRGKVIKGDGSDALVDGDSRSNEAMRTLQSWFLSLNSAAMAAGAPTTGAVSEEQQQALRALSDSFQKSTREAPQEQQKFSQDMVTASQALQARLDAIGNEFGPKVAEACEGGEGVTIDEAKCASVKTARVSREKAARDEYLAKVGPLASAFREKLRPRLSEDAKIIAQLKQAFGASPPTYVTTQLGGIARNEHLLITLLVGLNNDAVLATTSP